MKTRQILTICLMASALSACGAGERLKNIGKAPALAAIDNPTTQKGYKPVQMPMPTVEPAAYSPNSLWQTGSRKFFKDQRAAKVGDILTVQVSITDSAKIDNTTSRSRSGNDNVGLTGSVGSILGSALSGINEIDATNLANASSTSSSEGTGAIDRSETITTSVAAVVLQVLPNGNLVIEGRQEIRVNFEVREILVAGIVRPEDIASDNTIESEKIAEARIAYGGRGQLSDVQQPRYGQQVMDVILPF
ncbi:flagellar L-ring protein precursor FlgH [Cohaesibacter marisflavi]|uniref:Flagellar L-ring protein n=1 Tax=Cohaesibacter marisflavi TaxID=655353 RepID=A0A1I5J0M7_9HYPH|nr:flagellar basal body L-ring protein FlgH [Cohaesibacter marisflavi]SFO66394.1 flagellar L-ring protein precursor FlgH [Cohaesibacter marisflavi]